MDEARPPPRSRRRVNTINQNPFVDPEVNKSLPTLPSPLHLSDTHHAPSSSSLSPVKSPLSSSLQMASPPSYNLVRDMPSVKDLAKAFDEKISTSDLASRNPFRDLKSSAPHAAATGPDHQLRERSATDLPAVGSGMFADGRAMSIVSMATSAGPGPDIGCMYSGQEPTENGAEEYGYNDTNNPDYLQGPSMSRVGSQQSMVSSECPSEHNPWSPSLHGLQGREPTMTILDSRKVHGRGRAASMRFGPEIGSENTRATMPGAENDQVEAEIADQGHQKSEGIPTTVNEILLQESLERQRPRTNSANLGRSPPPVPPALPMRNPQRQPLFKQPMVLPVVPRSVGMSLQGSPFGLSHQVSSASFPHRPEFGVAKNAEFRLELERGRMSNPSIRNAHIQPSPTMLRLATTIAQEKGIPLHSGCGAVVRSVPFWVSIIIVQCSLVSTTASVTVIIRDQRSSSEYVEVGNQTIFWLVISILVFAFSGTATLFIWAKHMGYFSDYQKRLGLDEVGLLDRVVNDSGATRATGVESLRHEEGIMDLEANAGIHNRRTRAYETTPNQATLRPLRLVSAELPYQYPARSTIEGSGYSHTPVRPRAATAQSSVNGTSLFPMYPPSPITPITPAHVKGTPSFPFNNSHPGHFLSPSPGQYFNNSLVPEEEESMSPLANLQQELQDSTIRSAPAHQRHSIIASKRASSAERTKNFRESLELKSKLKRVQTFESYYEPAGEGVIVEHDDDELERIGRTSARHSRYPKIFNPRTAFDLRDPDGRLKAEAAARAGALIGFPNIPGIAAGTFGPHVKVDSKFNDQRGMMLDDLNPLTGKASSSTFVSSLFSPQCNNGSGNTYGGVTGVNPPKPKKKFAAVKDHLTEHHGQSLGSVIKAKKAKRGDDRQMLPGGMI